MIYLLKKYTAYVCAGAFNPISWINIRSNKPKTVKTLLKNSLLRSFFKKATNIKTGIVNQIIQVVAKLIKIK